MVMSETFPFCISTLTKEGSLQASKWQHVRMLLDPVELRELIGLISPCFFVNVAKIGKSHEFLIEAETLLTYYLQYIKSLQESSEKPVDKTRFSLALSKTLDPFYAMAIKEDQFLIKMKTPAIRMQLFQWHYLEETKQFITTAQLSQGLSWGLEFSFPQFYQDPKTYQPIEILKDLSNPNTQIFKQIQKWARSNTEPASFSLHHEKLIAPFKIGKKCLPWIQSYCSLRSRGWEVYHADRNCDHRE